ncbi:hypothetical protein AB9E15_15715 [Rhizobium leguminosarum]|uniref:hypothetical protein n=1 Tax=Rhizobium leguminosarum TaxID=384 RepID=UPI003F95C1D5
MTLSRADVERLLIGMFGSPVKDVQYVLGFQTSKGRVLALDRRAAVTRIWFLPPMRPLEGVTYIGPSKNDNLNGLLRPLNSAVAQRAEIESEPALRAFLAWYSISAPPILFIDYENEDFPSSILPDGGYRLNTNWDEILWAAITVGRPNTFHVFRHGDASLHEARFRWSMVRMALQQRGPSGYKIVRTDLFKRMDPTEKGAVNYFLGLILCKLFAARLLDAPWTIHLDVFRNRLNPALLAGRSRPDMVAQSVVTGDWHAFECKGRASMPGEEEKQKAKAQARRLVSIGGSACQLHVGCITFFRNDAIEFYWRDPDPEKGNGMELPATPTMWRAYYEPFYSAYRGAMAETETSAQSTDGLVYVEGLDIGLAVHPKIEKLLNDGNWAGARSAASELQEDFQGMGFQPDGLKVVAGDTWSDRFIEDKL